MNTHLHVVAVWALVLGASLAASDQAPLGAPDFYPSPERPVGWRGDGSGRFPGATPPTVWSRRPADITSEIRVQAARPAAKDRAAGDALAYFTVKDWLVAGPFPAADPAKDVDTDFLGGEADVQPDAGAKAGSTQWKAHRANEGSQSYYACNSHTCSHLWIDFLYAFGTQVPSEKGGPGVYTSLDNQAAYAHTYLYAPRAADLELDLLHSLPGLKLWMNGVPQRLDTAVKGKSAPLTIHLDAGWNRILVKAACGASQTQDQYKQWKSSWRFAAYIRPVGSGQSYAGGYETKNITWMTKLTGRNCSQPIVVGDQLFVGSGDTDLLCLDKRDGRIRWLHTVTFWDAMSVEERAAAKDATEPLRQALDKANADLVALLNAHITPQGLDATRQSVIDKQLEERKKLAKSLHDALSSGPKGKLYLNEVSAGNATPTSDGKRVYWVVQGSGGYLTSAFDLDGKQVWSSFTFQKSAGEHGSHRSPLLCAGLLLVSTDEQLIAYDAATGVERWRTPGSPHQHGINGTPIPVQYDGKPALQTAANLVGLDGTILAARGYTTQGCYIPVVEEGVLYNSIISRFDHSFEAITLPRKPGEKHQRAWTVDGKLLPHSSFFVASPLFADGLVYQIDIPGQLTVIDTRTRKLVQQTWMDGYNVNDRGLYGYCASPTLAGKHIYLLDDVGCGTVIRPGVEGGVVGSNVLHNVQATSRAPGHREQFYAGMYFDGRRMFLHGDEYLYCIAEGPVAVPPQK